MIEVQFPQLKVKKEKRKSYMCQEEARVAHLRGKNIQTQWADNSKKGT